MCVVCVCVCALVLATRPSSTPHSSAAAGSIYEGVGFTSKKGGAKYLYLFHPTHAPRNASLQAVKQGLLEGVSKRKNAQASMHHMQYVFHLTR